MPEPMMPSRTSSTALGAAAHDDAARPRNRRLVSSDTTAGATSSPAHASLLSSPNTSPGRGASPIPSTRIGSTTGRNHADARLAAGSGHNLGKKPSAASSWTPSWASVQGLATTFLGGGSAYDGGSERPGSRSGSQRRHLPQRQASAGLSPGPALTWGPAPPMQTGANTRPRLEDVAAGSLAEREAALKAIRTASVLESHDGVNGGLDIVGKFKKRSSDENLRDSPGSPVVEDHLVYIHHVQPNDTYAGIVLKYRCREDAFRKANGLWSRDNIQIRKWLALPVDACEVKGRPCEGPSLDSKQVDLLAPTPEATEQRHAQDQVDDFFSRPSNGKAAEQAREEDDDELPWTHVRWVSIDSFPRPVEIGRVARKALGYFPPRRKKSLHTVSTVSTPRGSLDIPGMTAISEPVGSPGSLSSRRQSLLSGRSAGTVAVQSMGTSSPSRSRGASGAGEAKPAWMRRPGGVGSLGRHVRAPGPESDYFNQWAKRHVPGLAADSLPSMSVMGSESARFGFGEEELAGIVESMPEAGQDLSNSSRQGSGLDKAAAAIETWLRGAFAKRPGTPLLGPRSRAMLAEEGDLIELADTNSDDGGGAAGHAADTSLLSSGLSGPSGRSDGDGFVRGRVRPGGWAKDKKDD